MLSDWKICGQRPVKASSTGSSTQENKFLSLKCYITNDTFEWSLISRLYGKYKAGDDLVSIA